MKLRILVLLLFSTLLSIAKPESYKIRLSLKNTNDSTVYLAHYYEGKVFVVDTSALNSKGEALFSKNHKLHSGLYLIYLPSKKYFDVFIGDDQEFTLYTDINASQKEMRVEGAIETSEFYKYQLFLIAKNKEKDEIIEKFKDDKINIDKNLDLIDTEVRDYIKSISIRLNNSSLANFTMFSLEPKIPNYNEIIDSQIKNRKDSIQTLSYFYNKNHYWDYANLSDSTIIRTPILKSKLDDYFNKIIIPHPDTVVCESIKLIERSRTNKTMFRYLCSYCFNFSLNSKIMGMDEAFYKIAKKYYLSGDAYWITDSIKLKIEEKVLKLKYNLIGEKARDIKMQTIDGELTSLYEIDANLILMLFWEPDCGHCKKEIPEIKTEILDKYSCQDLKILAINIQDNTEKWSKFIEEHNLFDFINCYDPNNTSNYSYYYNIESTPSIYLLDKNKIIIAKKIDVKTLAKIIETKLKK